MNNFQYLPIPKEYSDRIRQTMQDDFGHAVEKSIAGELGSGPCRSCLRQTQPGEERLLFSYAPVGSDNPYNEVGPVYIHAHACTPYKEVNNFPADVKNGRLPIPLVLRAYNKEGRMIAAKQVGEQDAETIIGQLFENQSIETIHIRNAEVQCFIAAVKRAN